jgi:DNA primase
LQKLATHTLPGEEDTQRVAFLDAMAQLNKQVLQQRIDELQAKWAAIGKASALTPEEHAELKNLQQEVRRS